MIPPEFWFCWFQHEQNPGGSTIFDPEETLKRVASCLYRASWNNPLCAHGDLVFSGDTHNFHKDFFARIDAVGSQELRTRGEDLKNLKHIVDDLKRSAEILYHMPSLHQDIPASIQWEAKIVPYIQEIQEILEKCGVIGWWDNPNPRDLNWWEKNRVKHIIWIIQKEIQRLYEELIAELEVLEIEKIWTSIKKES